jgi:hypothetical protein
MLHLLFILFTIVNDVSAYHLLVFEKASQVNSSSSSPCLAITTEASDLMRANVCLMTRGLVTCLFINYIL